MTDTTTKAAEPVTIKKYANRRLYNTGTSTYVTLEDLAAMVKTGEDFVVYDAKTGEDITRSVLAQIIFEQENKEGQNSVADRLPAPADPVLRRQHADAGAALSRSLHRVADPRAGEVPQSDGASLRRQPIRRAGGNGAAEHGNVRARLCHVHAVCAARKPGSGTAPEPEKPAAKSGGEIDDLKRELDEMRRKVDKLTGGND